MNIEDIEFQMDPDSSNFKTETNHILEDGNLHKIRNGTSNFGFTNGEFKF